MLIRHMLGEAVLDARLAAGSDGDDHLVLVLSDEIEEFELDRVEAIFYQLVATTPEEILGLEEAGYFLQMPRPRGRRAKFSLECA